MSDQVSQYATSPDLTKTLVLEIELPTFYAEDLASENFREWVRTAGGDPDNPHDFGQEVLHEIGEVYSGLLTIKVSGEKDSEIVRVPVLMRGARVEDRPPTPESQYKDMADRLAERVDERTLDYGRWSDG